MYFLRWSRRIVTRLWKSIALLSNHWKYSHSASKISSKRGSISRSVSNVSPKFSSVRTVLFRIKKNHIAIYICSKSLLFLCFASLRYLTYIFTSGQRYFISLSFFTLSHLHVHGLCHFDSLKYPGFLPTRRPGFFQLFVGLLVDAKREYFRWSP